MSVNLKAVPLPPFRSCPPNIPGIPLKCHLVKYAPYLVIFLSHPKEREEYNFVTSKGKGRPGLSFVEVRASINRFGGGTMENIEP